MYFVFFFKYFVTYFLFISKFQIQWLVTMLDSAGFMEPLFNIGVFILCHSLIFQ